MNANYLVISLINNIGLEISYYHTINDMAYNYG